MSWGNFSLIVNSKFQPFSFERYIQPYQMYGEAYKEVENALGELSTKASVWEEMANEQTDPYAYKMYKNYANDLENRAGQLAREGLNATSRRDMLNMRARYSKEITPIEQAYTARQKQAEQQQQAILQDPTLMMSRRASTTSLDDYIRNPQLGYDAYSGKLIASQASQAASALSKEMRNNPRKWREILGKQYYETMMQKGFSSDVVLQAMQNPNVAPELQKIVEDAVGSSGIRGWNNQELLDRAYDYARQGLWSAVGETQYQTLQNQEYLNPLQRKQYEALNTPKDTRFALNPSNIYSTRELQNQEKQYKDTMNRYSQYFYKENGKWKMTKEGWDEYNREIKATKGNPYTTPEGTTILTDAESSYVGSPFRQFIDSLGVTRQEAPSFTDQISRNVGEAWGKYAEESPTAKTAKYDATKYTEYIESLPSSDTYQNTIKGKINQALGTLSGLDEIDLDSKTGTWKRVGTLSKKDLMSGDYIVVSRAPSELSMSDDPNTLVTSFFIMDKKGNVKRYKAPRGINTTAENGRDAAIMGKLKVQRALQDPDLSDLDRTKLQNLYDDLNQQQYMYSMQLDYVNKIKDQESTPYYVH